MRIKPDAPGHRAASAATSEAHRWLEVADSVPTECDDVAPTEAAVVAFHDPASDLDRRAKRWTYLLPDHRLDSLAIFAAGLAKTEADAWRRDELHVATQAYEERRFLAGDRILHWAVPWLDAVGRCYPARRVLTHHGRDVLLEIGDHLRPAPYLGVDNGLAAIGEDAYGPTQLRPPDVTFVRSLWSGALLLDATVRSLTSTIDDTALLRDTATRADLVTLYENTSARWRGFAATHPGSSLLWHALEARAERTATALEDHT